MTDTALPGFDDILAAARRLRGHVVTTPLLESDALNQLVGGRLLIKAEVLQHTGSFKFRGAYNRIAAMDAAERKRGIVAFSSGNHAQGAAFAARLLEAPAVIVMPRDAPALKIENTRGFGAEIVLYDRYTEDREAIGAKLAKQRGLTLVPPFDDPYVIAGQGTIGLEIANQCALRGIAPDDLLTPCSGGGLMAGCATALHRKLPGVKAYTAEPEHYDDMRRSLEAGKRQRNIEPPPSICDALLMPEPGALTFAINKPLLAGGYAVPERDVREAMRLASRHLKLVVEPGGAVALAAVLSGRHEAKSRTVVVVASGGNVEPALFAEILGGR
ncbi:MAG: threonine/serine dehydratase [Alphaproteobacteria bacterium]